MAQMATCMGILLGLEWPWEALGATLAGLGWLALTCTGAGRSGQLWQGWRIPGMPAQRWGCLHVASGIG